MSNHTISTAERSTPPIWQIATVGAVLLLMYAPVLVDLFADWYRDENYSHGFLIIPIAAYIVWKKRDVLKTIPLESSKWALPIIIGSLAMFLAGTAGMEYFTVRVSFVGLLLGLTLYFAGLRFVREIWFAFFFLLFMIPVPYVIYYSATFPLQVLGTKVAAGVLGVLGVPHLRQGNIIHLQDNYSLEVAEACSGLRSLVTLLALGALLAYWTQNKVWKGIFLFAMTIPIAIVANIVRICATAILASSVSRAFAESTVHEFSGTVVFMISLVCLLILSSLLRIKEVTAKIDDKQELRS